MSERVVRAERVIGADAATLFDVVAHPARHAEIDGSGTVRDARPGGPERLSLGARFGMDMKMGLPYRISNEVIEFTEGRVIAWRHISRAVWRYTFEPVEGGTLVTEEWDYGASPVWPALAAAGFPARNQANMAATLERLAAAVQHEAPA